MTILVLHEVSGDGNGSSDFLRRYHEEESPDTDPVVRADSICTMLEADTVHRRTNVTYVLTDRNKRERLVSEQGVRGQPTDATIEMSARSHEAHAALCLMKEYHAILKSGM